MPIIDLYSKRRKASLGSADVFQYEDIPRALRVQFVYIMRRALGDTAAVQGSYRPGQPAHVYKAIVEGLREEYGVFCLDKDSGYGMYPTPNAELEKFVLDEVETDRVLDAMELVCRGIDKLSRAHEYRDRSGGDEIANQALSDINARFREHGFGFEFIDGEMLRVDSQFIHAESVKPALRLLHDGKFAGAQEEFLKAYEHYRSEKYKEAMADSLNAFESVLKTICAKRGWTHAPNATSKALIECCFNNNLLPSHQKAFFSGLRSTLEAGVPTYSNRDARHGQGEQKVEVPPHVVAYTLHMTAAAIVFLVECDKALTG